MPNAPKTFLPNPTVQVADVLENGSTLSYNGFQTELRHRSRGGLDFQLHYTFSKSLSDSAGNTQGRVEPFIDNANPQFDRTRSEFDITHVLGSTFTYELPFGHGKMLLGGANGLVDRVVGGWKIASIVGWQSGNPFAILSGTNRGVLNREGRSGTVTAFTTLPLGDIKKHLGMFTAPNGNLYWIDPKFINTDGRAVGPDGLTYSPSFTGQVFYNPLPGQVGNMHRLQFDGPATYQWDASIIKNTKITERIATRFEVDLLNVMNSSELGIFSDTNFNVNSTSFGRVTSALPSRIVQASLRIDF
jgi:hypothetical protein